MKSTVILVSAFDANPPAGVRTAAKATSALPSHPVTPQNDPWQGKWAAPSQPWETQPWDTQAPLMLRNTATGEVTQWTGQKGQTLPSPTTFMGLLGNTLGVDVPVSGPDGWMQQYQMLVQTANSWLAIANPALATSVLDAQKVKQYQQQGLLPLKLPAQIGRRRIAKEFGVEPALIVEILEEAERRLAQEGVARSALREAAGQYSVAVVAFDRDTPTGACQIATGSAGCQDVEW